MTKIVPFCIVVSLLALISCVAGQTITNTTLVSRVGNCVSKKYTFGSSGNARIAHLAYPAVGLPTTPPADIDATRVDFMLDFGKDNIAYVDDHMSLSLKPTPQGAGYSSGARLTTTRYAKYGKFTIRMSAPPAGHGGWVSYCNTMSGKGDEIDWELVGKRTKEATTNVFYKGIAEFNMHDTVEPMPFNSSVQLIHDYTIDWKPDSIIWSIDGNVVRTLLYGNSWQNTTMCPGCWWFPDTPSVVSIGIWDGSLISGEWAGTHVDYGNLDKLSMNIYSLDIQCYNETGMPVEAQPPLAEQQQQQQEQEQQNSPSSSSSAGISLVASSASLRTFTMIILLHFILWG